MWYVFGINADRGEMGNPEKLLALLLHAWKPIFQGNTKLLTLLGSGETPDKCHCWYTRKT